MIDGAMGPCPIGGAMAIGPGGGQLVASRQYQAPQQIRMDDLPFSSIGHKAMWEGIFDMVQREVDDFMKTQRAPRIPMPNIPEQQIEMIFNSYDMEGAGILSR